MERQRLILGGVLGAGLVIGLLYFAAKPGDLPLLGQSLFGLLLGSTGAVYLGAALSKGEPRWLAAELAAALAVLALAWLGLWGSPKWLAAGYALHALWGAAHYPRLVKTSVVPWLPPLSAAFDLVVAAWILWRL
jgi:uncharacterized protein DUF6010